MFKIIPIMLLVLLSCGSDNTIAPEINPLLGTWQINQVEYIFQVQGIYQEEFRTYIGLKTESTIIFTESELKLHVELSPYTTYDGSRIYSKTPTVLFVRYAGQSTAEIWPYKLEGKILTLLAGERIVLIPGFKSVKIYATK